MSSAALHWAFEKIVPFLKDQVEKLVVLRLADRADPAGVCWPGHSRTAADLNISTRSVQSAVKHLESIGLMEVRERVGTSSLIYLKLDHVVPAAIVACGKKKPKKKKKVIVGGETISPLCSTSRGEAISPLGCSHFTPGGEAISPKPIIEPKTEPPQPMEKVVVVVDDGIEWPAGLQEVQKQACCEALVMTKPERHQALVDELSGAITCRRIGNPAGWLRALAKRELEGGVLLELAPAVAAARAAKAEAAARAEVAMRAPRAPPPSQAGAKPVLSPRQAVGLQAALDQLAAIKSGRALSQPIP